MTQNIKKFIFITGGVTSSLGKGMAAASIAALLERRRIRISMIKMDPYINVDPGTMSPTQHGEVFVTDDGAETDLDLGHYERFTNLKLNKNNNFTTGQVYSQVIENERIGKYLGKTVQVVPHITDEIKERILRPLDEADLIIGEIGGTVGDIESLPFLESIRQIAQDYGPENVLFIHLVLVPYLQAAGELKTKPAQHSVKELRSIGLFPQILICRSEMELENSLIDKLAMFCNVPKGQVFQSLDVPSLYHLPLHLHHQGLDAKIAEILGIWTSGPDISDLKQVVHNWENPKDTIKVALVGKYTELAESYKSLIEAMQHAGVKNQLKIDFEITSSEEIEEDVQCLKKFDGVLVPGGFGERGTEGKVRAIQYARENNIPFLGICLGMQLSILEYARNVLKLKNAQSQEFSEDGNLVIHYLPDQNSSTRKGGSMRLGSYHCRLKPGSLANRIYGSNNVEERHRHRFEVNNAFRTQLEKAGMLVSGENVKRNLVEIVEIPNHPYFLGCQFHPEFKSGPTRPHPIFDSFVQASYDAKIKKNQKNMYENPLAEQPHLM